LPDRAWRPWKIERRAVKKNVVNHNGPYRDLYIYLIDGRVRAEDEPEFEMGFLGNWVEDRNSFLFFSYPAMDWVSNLVAKTPDLDLVDEYHFSYDQWQGSELEPFTIGDFLVTPPWKDQPDTPVKKKILLDPGVVFGTGLHPTTKDCLLAMSLLRQRFGFGRVLDIGTGTGILALAAIKLGAEKALAVDLNPLSVNTARRNVVLNGLNDHIQVIEGRAEDVLAEQADLIVANIHYEVIIQLMSHKEFLSKPWIIISGLMRTQARNIKAEMNNRGMKLIQEWDKDMTWYTMLVKCR
jgi:ribosomal protein L11 methyltransferase